MIEPEPNHVLKVGRARTMSWGNQEKETYLFQDRRRRGRENLLPRGRGPLEADHRPAARFSLVVVLVQRPDSASGGSISCHRARLSRHGIQRGAGADRSATDLR